MDICMQIDKYMHAGTVLCKQSTHMAAPNMVGDDWHTPSLAWLASDSSITTAQMALPLYMIIC